MFPICDCSNFPIRGAFMCMFLPTPRAGQPGVYCGVARGGDSLIFETVAPCRHLSASSGDCGALD